MHIANESRFREGGYSGPNKLSRKEPVAQQPNKSGQAVGNEAGTSVLMALASLVSIYYIRRWQERLHILIPTLTTERIILRGIRASDWADFNAMNADPQVRQWLGGTLLTRAETWCRMEAALGQWALRGYGLFAVEVDGHFAGCVGLLHPADWPEPELAWTLANPFWGRGLATEAARLARDWAFDRFRWPRLVSYIKPTNQRSRRVAERLGAAPGGSITLRETVADVWVHSRQRDSQVRREDTTTQAEHDHPTQ